LREEIRAYQNAVSGVVARYDGFVAKFMGDGVLVYFGYPRAHEDDAERAVRAVLEIEAAVTGLETRVTERLAVRIGIATGLVVVGDLVGEGSAQEQRRQHDGLFYFIGLRAREAGKQHNIPTFDITEVNQALFEHLRE
jgi:class 3 adenylate cyclase